MPRYTREDLQIFAETDGHFGQTYVDPLLKKLATGKIKNPFKAFRDLADKAALEFEEQYRLYSQTKPSKSFFSNGARTKLAQHWQAAFEENFRKVMKHGS